MVWDIYDGARSGIANHRGAPHFFNAIMASDGGYTDYFELTLIDSELLQLAQAQWSIYRAWELRFHSGEVSLETHPGHGGVHEEYDSLDEAIKQRLAVLEPGHSRFTASFRVLDGQPELPDGCLREVEVEWTSAAQQGVEPD